MHPIETCFPVLSSKYCRCLCLEGGPFTRVCFCCPVSDGRGGRDYASFFSLRPTHQRSSSLAREDRQTAQREGKEGAGSLSLPRVARWTRPQSRSAPPRLLAAGRNACIRTALSPTPSLRAGSRWLFHTVHYCIVHPACGRPNPAGSAPSRGETATTSRRQPRQRRRRRRSDTRHRTIQDKEE